MITVPFHSAIHYCQLPFVLHKSIPVCYSYNSSFSSLNNYNSIQSIYNITYCCTFNCICQLTIPKVDYRSILPHHFHYFICQLFKYLFISRPRRCRFVRVFPIFLLSTIQYQSLSIIFHQLITCCCCLP